MNEFLETAQTLNLNIESQSFVSLAKYYLAYKVFSDILLAVVLILIAYMIGKGIKKMMEL